MMAGLLSLIWAELSPLSASSHGRCLGDLMVGSGTDLAGLFRTCRWATKVKVIVGPGFRPCGLSSFAYGNTQ